MADLHLHIHFIGKTCYIASIESDPVHPHLADSKALLPSFYAHA